MKTAVFVFAFAALVALSTAGIVGYTASGIDGNVYKIDAETGGASLLTSVASFTPVNKAAVGAAYDGKLLITNNVDATIAAFDLETSKLEVILGDATTPTPATDLTTLEEGAVAEPTAIVVTDSGKIVSFGANYASLLSEEDDEWTQAAFIGDIATTTAADGVGTDAALGVVTGACLDPSDGESIYFVEPGTLRKVTSDATVTTVAGDGTFGDSAEGFGTSAVFDATSCVVSADGASVYLAIAGCIGKVNVEDAEFTFVAGCADETNVYIADGVGTDAILADADTTNSIAKGIAMLPNGNLVFSSDCEGGNANTYAVIRQVDSEGAVSVFSGSYLKAGCTEGVEPTVTGAALTGPDADDVVFQEGLGPIVFYNEVCGKFFPVTQTDFDLSADELAECDSLEGGDLPGVIIITGKGIPISQDTNIGDAQVNDDGELSVAEGATVNATSIVVSGNGSVFCNGGDFEANSLTLGDATFFRVLIAKTNNGKGVINGNAKLAGFVVIIVDGAYNWAEGTQNVILTFLTKEGGFKGVKTYTREPKYGRRLLQAADAAVDCTETACTATSTSEGDDDDVGLLAAVIILGVVIVLLVIAAIFIVAKKSSDKNVQEMSAAAAPYNADYSSSSYFGSESSSSSYAF